MPAGCSGPVVERKRLDRADQVLDSHVAVQHCAQLREVKLAPAAGPLTSNDAPMGYLPVLTNLTHWPWFLNLVPKFFQPPFLH